ncbi:MAG: ABC-three component system middle component 6 [Solirubrobacteraceae bacterium]
MILPTKHLPLERTLLAGGARLLTLLTRPATVSELWDRASNDVAFPSFDHLVLALDLLFALGMIGFRDGRLHRTRPT